MKQYYSYTHFKKDINKLLGQLASSEFEVILGVARGGLCMAHCVAEGLDLRDVQSIRTELYDDTIKREEITLVANCDFKDKKRVLVVDDIADSGETLQAVMNYLEKNFQDIEFKSATLFYKKSSLYEPHYWINEANEWIEFFWEKDFG
ncbi:MAG: phosphoribosyltransferase family protein [Sulfurimonas sp.]|nr:phosphoribosyltransferase family protein [Sulfurimonas sp.]